MITTIITILTISPSIIIIIILIMILNPTTILFSILRIRKATMAPPTKI
jgi:hypothetical protein